MLEEVFTSKTETATPWFCYSTQQRHPILRLSFQIRMEDKEKPVGTAKKATEEKSLPWDRQTCNKCV